MCCIRNQNDPFDISIHHLQPKAQWPIGYGVGLRIKRSSVRIRPWPLRWVFGQGSLLQLSQGEAFTLASISYLAILVKYILAKKKKKKKEIESEEKVPVLIVISGRFGLYLMPNRFHLLQLCFMNNSDQERHLLSSKMSVHVSSLLWKTCNSTDRRYSTVFDSS